MVLAIIAVVLLVLSWQIYATWGTIRQIDGYVTSTDRDDGHKYVYLADDPGMLYNDDSWLHMKGNSGTLHGQIPDKTNCKFVVYGFRRAWIIFDSAPNILSAECAL